MDSFAKIVGIIFGALIVAFALSILIAFPVKWLWNSSVTELFGFKEIDVWMAWKLSLLCAFLIKGASFSSK